MSYAELDMDDRPYASLVEDDDMLNGDKQGRKWTKKQKAIGAAVILLLLIVTAGVVVGICTRGNNVIPTTTPSPIRFATKTVAPKTTVTARTTSSTTVTPKTTSAAQTTTTPMTTSPTTTVTTTTSPTTTVTTTTSPTTTVTTTTSPTTTVTTTTSPTTTVTAKAAPTSVTWPSCENGSAPLFLLQHNATVGIQLRTMPSTSLGECSDHCALSEDCHVLQYDHNNCTVYERGLNAQTPGAKVLTKGCVKSNRVCSAPFHFAAHEHMILVGFAREVVVAEKIEECFAACLNANDTFGFLCKSAMFYPFDQECILNTESHLDRHDSWIEESEDMVIFIDNNCARPDHTEDGVIVPTEDPAACPPAFVRSKQMVLVGTENYVVENVDSVTECLEMCSNPPSEAEDHFECKSVAYYYEMQECIINAKTSKEEPEFFVPEGGERLKIDYFDVSRHLGNQTCPEGTDLRSIHALEEENGVQPLSGNNTCLCL